MTGIAVIAAVLFLVLEHLAIQFVSQCVDGEIGFIAAAIFAALFGLSRGLPSAAAGLFFWP